MSNPIHGHTVGGKSSPEHSSWCAMIQRCTNPKNIGYHRYGGRGIGVCERWRDFENFLADMGPRPRGTSIDRKRVDEGYNHDNCRWLSYQDQMRNRRNSTITYELVARVKDLLAYGLPHRTIGAWFGLAHSTVGRIHRGEQWV